MDLDFGQVQNDLEVNDKQAFVSSFITQEEIVRKEDKEYYVIKGKNLNSQNCYYLKLKIRGTGVFKVSLVNYGKYGNEEYQDLGIVIKAAAAWEDFDFAFVPQSNSFNAIVIEGISSDTLVLYKDFYVVNNYLDRFDFTHLLKFKVTGELPIVVNRDLIKIENKYELDVRQYNFNISFVGIIGKTIEKDFLIPDPEIIDKDLDAYLSYLEKNNISGSAVMHSKTIYIMPFLFDYLYKI